MIPPIAVPPDVHEEVQSLLYIGGRWSSVDSLVGQALSFGYNTLAMWAHLHPIAADQLAYRVTVPSEDLDTHSRGDYRP